MPVIRRLAGADMPAVTAIVVACRTTSPAMSPARSRDASQDGWVVTESGHVAGFAVATAGRRGDLVDRRRPGAARSRPVAGDDAAGPRAGRAGRLRVSVVEAKAVDRSAGYLPHEARVIWEHHGFVQTGHHRPAPRLAAGQPDPQGRPADVACAGVGAVTAHTEYPDFAGDVERRWK